jgi:hypothetical protein
MSRVILPYKEAKVLINEGDILLFRGTGWISKLIYTQTQTYYSHVALASWVNGRANTEDGRLECVEFREWRGGRSISLKRAVDDHRGRIDVYRPIPTFSKISFDQETKTTNLVKKDFNGRAVTDILRDLTGLPYGWKRIWWLIKYKLVGIRVFLIPIDTFIDDKVHDIVYPVCSTTVAYAFNINDYDLIYNRSDSYTEPGDIAKSPRINYLFTIGE